jgi:hypothetical protein
MLDSVADKAVGGEAPSGMQALNWHGNYAHNILKICICTDSNGLIYKPILCDRTTSKTVNTITFNKMKSSLK